MPVHNFDFVCVHPRRRSAAVESASVVPKPNIYIRENRIVHNNFYKLAWLVTCGMSASAVPNLKAQLHNVARVLVAHLVRGTSRMDPLRPILSCPCLIWLPNPCRRAGHPHFFFLEKYT
jgi:hypothetical protein